MLCIIICQSLNCSIGIGTCLTPIILCQAVSNWIVVYVEFDRDSSSISIYFVKPDSRSTIIKYYAKFV